MFSFSKKMIRDKWKVVILFFGGLVVFLEMFMAFYPYIQEKTNEISEIVKATLPKEMFAAFNLDANLVSFSSLESFLATKYFSMIWPILIIILAIIVANYLIINEIHSGTVESTLSLPTSRKKIFFERYFTGFIMILFVSILSILVVPLMAEINGINYDFSNYIVFSIECALFALTIYSLAIFISMSFIDKGKSNLTIGGILMAMYVLSALALINENLDCIKYFSFFNYFNGTHLMSSDVLDIYSAVVFIGFSLIFTFIAWRLFEKRDLAV